jgi:hypothetical protein
MKCDGCKKETYLYKLILRPVRDLFLCHKCAVKFGYEIETKKK